MKHLHDDPAERLQVLQVYAWAASQIVIELHARGVTHGLVVEAQRVSAVLSSEARHAYDDLRFNDQWSPMLAKLMAPFNETEPTQ